jgi:endonuclease/exonuclease/phosphatase (EEP) superfamily protein YafD
VLRKLKVGVFERSKQVRELADFIKRSPYRVICAGDFNDMPYSYNYQYMKKRLRNSFEESGKGFGFTYNGNTLKMLRIDNQFYSTGVRSLDFQTLDSIKFSDHFPVRGEYLIEDTH